MTDEPWPRWILTRENVATANEGPYHAAARPDGRWVVWEPGGRPGPLYRGVAETRAAAQIEAAEALAIVCERNDKG